MDVLPTALNGMFVFVMTLVLTWYLRDRFNSIDQRFAQVDQRFAQVDERFRQVDLQLGELRRDVGEVRSQLVTIALAVGSRSGPEAANG